MTLNLKMCQIHDLKLDSLHPPSLSPAHFLALSFSPSLPLSSVERRKPPCPRSLSTSFSRPLPLSLPVSLSLSLSPLSLSFTFAFALSPLLLPFLHAPSLPLHLILPTPLPLLPSLSRIRSAPSLPLPPSLSRSLSLSLLVSHYPLAYISFLSSTACIYLTPSFLHYLCFSLLPSLPPSFSRFLPLSIAPTLSLSRALAFSLASLWTKIHS